MQILVTGGTGVVGRSTITALLQRGHVVHLLSRHAERDVAQWAQGVHPVVANVANAASLEGAADGCDAVVHLTAIVSERGRETFQSVNVDGTRNVVREAERAGVRTFVHVSSLGADTGESAYHRSKRLGEAIVRQFAGEWIIVRPGNVYGPGDEQLSMLLRMVRTLPALPMIGGGDQRIQPIWHEDVAEALAVAVERGDLRGRVLEIAGEDLTSQSDLVHRMARLVGRNVPQVEVPGILAKLGTRVAAALGVETPLSESQVSMVREGNAISSTSENALFNVLGITPTPLDRGLEMLTQVQDEQLPDKRFWVEITGAAMGPEQLMHHLRAHFGELMASFIETNGPAMLDEDAALTLTLPLRGQMQVRVAEVEPRVLTLVTLAGHPLSGAVRFLSEARGDDLRFEIQVFDRAATMLDFLVMRTVGERVQDDSWREMAENVVRAAGGAAPAGVRLETETLDADQAEHIEEWLRELANARRRDEAGV
jgi:uncharacterized protein YbjT (DUF2867 family)